jgi:hypothetical protein
MIPLAIAHSSRDTIEAFSQEVAIYGFRVLNWTVASEVWSAMSDPKAIYF